tara:strand:- start:3722 stop:5749 length:2028 start_codon:yes stop_codon:yes gene_type:complete
MLKKIQQNKLSFVILFLVTYLIYFIYSQISPFRIDEELAAELLAFKASLFSKTHNIDLHDALNKLLFFDETINNQNLKDYILKNVPNWKLNKLIYFIFNVDLNSDVSFISYIFSTITSLIIFACLSLKRDKTSSLLISILYFTSCLNVSRFVHGHIHAEISSLLIFIFFMISLSDIKLKYFFLAIIFSFLMLNLYPPPLIFLSIYYLCFLFLSFKKNILKFIKVSLINFALIIFFYLIFLYLYGFLFEYNYSKSVYGEVLKQGNYLYSLTKFIKNIFIFIKLLFFPISLVDFKNYFTHIGQIIPYSLIFPLIMTGSFIELLADNKIKKYHPFLISLILYFSFIFTLNIQLRYIYIVYPIIYFISLDYLLKISTNKNNIKKIVISSILINIFLVINYLNNDKSQYNNYISSEIKFFDQYKNILLQNNLKYIQVLSLHNSINDNTKLISKIIVNENDIDYAKNVGDFLYNRNNSVIILPVSNNNKIAPIDWNNDNDEWIRLLTVLPNYEEKRIFFKGKEYYKLITGVDKFQNYCWINVENINDNEIFYKFDNFHNNLKFLNLSQNNISESKFSINHDSLRGYIKFKNGIEMKLDNLWFEKIFIKSTATQTKELYLNQKIYKFNRIFNSKDLKAKYIKIKPIKNEEDIIYFEIFGKKIKNLISTKKMSYENIYTQAEC